jgi:hypothetical protein
MMTEKAFLETLLKEYELEDNPFELLGNLKYWIENRKKELDNGTV